MKSMKIYTSQKFLRVWWYIVIVECIIIMRVSCVITNEKSRNVLLKKKKNYEKNYEKL